MFGYIITNYDELKIKDFKTYHAYYCGLCRSLRERSGVSSQISLTYDMTFLGLLLSSLYEDGNVSTAECRCIAHPGNKHLYVKSDCLNYAADMNIVMTYYKCVDDWNDEKKILKVFYGHLLKKKEKRLFPYYEEKIKIITENLANLYMAEKQDCKDLDEVSGYFGRICEAIFVYKKDEWSDFLAKIGFYLGKFIYLLDAYEDLEEDKKKKCFNPLVGIQAQKKEKFDEFVHQILLMMMSNVGRAFERLPIVTNASILKNIIYSGVWQKYNKIVNKIDEDNLKKNNPDWRKV